MLLGHTYQDFYKIASPTQNLKNLPRSAPGPIIDDDLERRNGTNPSKLSLGKSTWVHRKATEDKWMLLGHRSRL